MIKLCLSAHIQKLSFCGSANQVSFMDRESTTLEKNWMHFTSDISRKDTFFLNQPVLIRTKL